MAALEPERTSWTTMRSNGCVWQVGDRPVLVVAHAGHDVTLPAFLLADLPAELLGVCTCRWCDARPGPTT
ncbi:hypothetical protein [Streptomyces sp. NPDC002156]